MAPKFQLTVVSLVLYTLFVDQGVYSAAVGSGTEHDPSPIIFIPGKGGSRIEAKIDRSPEDMLNPDCPSQSDWSRIWLDVWQFLWPGQIDCWAENVRLYYNEETRQATTAPGIEFRVPGFGDTYTVEYVDDSWAAFMMGNIGGYLVHLTEQLDEWGYVRGQHIRAAPYDFRFAPHSHMQYFTDLRELVEDTYEINNQKKVTILSHSMGGIHALYFLHTVSQEWKDKYIKAFVPVNSPWKGTTIISNLYTSGYNWGIAPLDREIVKMQQRSWETGVLLLPQADAWGPHDVLVQTPTRNYTVNDYSDYFDDIDFPLGKQLFENIQHESYDMGHPGVDTYCVYSYGLDTPDHLVYEEGEFPDGHAEMVDGPGDGTVNLRSLEYCRTWLEAHDDHHVATVKTYESIQHIDLLFYDQFVKYLKETVLDN